MRAFFTIGAGEVQAHNGVNAVDIITERFNVRIRANGISIWDAEKKEETQKIDLDLADEIIRPKEPKKKNEKEEQTKLF